MKVAIAAIGTSLAQAGKDAYVGELALPGREVFALIAMGPRAKELKDLSARWVEKGL